MPNTAKKPTKINKYLKIYTHYSIFNDCYYFIYH